MNPEKTETALHLLEVLFRANEKFRKLQSQLLVNSKLTIPQFGVLEILYRLGSIHLKRISELMMVTGANITCVADNLEKEGLIKRVHSKEDRRVVLAELTSSGKQKIEQILPAYKENILSAASKLTEEEQKEVIQLLEKFEL